MCARKGVFAKIQLNSMNLFHSFFLQLRLSKIGFHAFALKLRGKVKISFSVLCLEVNIRALRML